MRGGRGPQPGPCRPRHSGELSDPQEQTSPPLSRSSRLDTDLALHTCFSMSALTCLSVKKLTQRRKGPA